MMFKLLASYALLVQVAVACFGGGGSGGGCSPSCPPSGGSCTPCGGASRQVASHSQYSAQYQQPRAQPSYAQQPAYPAAPRAQAFRFPAPAPSYPAPAYPAPAYPAPSYPAPRYPAPRYPAPSYPAPSYPAPAPSRPRCSCSGSGVSSSSGCSSGSSSQGCAPQQSTSDCDCASGGDYEYEYDGDSESEYDEYVEDGGSDNTQIGETDAGLSAEYAEEYPEESEYADEGAAAVEQPVPYNLEDPILDDVQIPCQFLTCDFEGDTLCLYESKTELEPSKLLEDANLTKLVPWGVWRGRFANRLTGIPSAAQGKHYAVTYLRQNESAILMTDMLYANGQTLVFQAFEATNDIQLRLCCDSLDECQWESESVSELRKWSKVTSKCPPETRRVYIVCQNRGKNQGACGIDDIKVINDECDQILGRKIEKFEIPFRRQ